MKQYNEQELQNFLTRLKATPVTLRLIELMQTCDKEATHWLQDGYTGATKNLAMMGG
jgi:cyclic pyranopterin phosphate synthase